MARTLTLVCEHCGKQFESNRKKRFCSDYCQYRYRYEKKIQTVHEPKKCAVCGKEFIPKKIGQVYCSRKCISVHATKTRPHNPPRCVVCGTVIEGGSGGTKYCSDACREKAHTRICPECGKEFITYNHNQKYCSPECVTNSQRDKTVYTCKQCGKQFHRRKKQEDQCIFCSRECSQKWHQNHRPMVQREFYFGIHTICEQCGKPFFAYNKTTRFCSEECKTKWNEEHKKPVVLYLRRRECQHCGKVFYTHSNNQKYCSIECQKRAYSKSHEIVRRTRKQINGEMDNSISLIKLCKRDHGICALCGEPVNMLADKNSNEYGSIDHIVPLAKGGTHTWDNVQLAHRICNSLKRDT